jgi:hypothetical protein
MKWTPGNKYECIMSASPAYKVGDVVECYQNDKEWKCINGRDGLEDICSMLVSAFKPVDEMPEKRLSVVGK